MLKEWPFKDLRCAEKFFDNNVRGSKFSPTYNSMKITLNKCD